VKEEPLTETLNTNKENKENEEEGEEEDDSSEDDEENIEIVLNTDNTTASGTNLNKNFFRTPINIQAGNNQSQNTQTH
jgi:hypothetical protein